MEERMPESREHHSAECAWYHGHQRAVIRQLPENTSAIVAVDWKARRTPAHTAEAALDVSHELSCPNRRPIVYVNARAMFAK